MPMCSKIANWMKNLNEYICHDEAEYEQFEEARSEFLPV